jgi:tetratricopeptide (TPR) repeat protein
MTVKQLACMLIAAAFAFRPATAQKRGGGIQSSSDTSRIVLLRGRVTMEDGTHPPAPVSIERNCAGVASQVATTDPAGRFVMRLDLSDFNMRLGVSQVGGCLFSAVFPGYRSTTAGIVLSPGNEDSLELGTLTLRPVADSAGVTISANSLEAPKASRQAYEKGLREFGKMRWPRARDHFQKAVTVYPRHAEAWYRLGLTLEQLADTAAARTAYRRATEAEPKYILPYAHLAETEIAAGLWPEASEAALQGVALDPRGSPEAHLLAAFALSRLKQWEEAEDHARTAISLDVRRALPKAQQVLGIVLASRGRYGESAKHLREYLRLAPDAPDAPLVKKQADDVARLAETER